MAQQVFGPAAVVSVLNRAFTNTSPSNSVFANQVATAGATDATQLAFAKAFGAQYAVGKTAADLSALLMTNMGLDNALLAAALTDYIAANGTQNVGIIAWQLSSILSNLENDATYGAAAKAWNAEVTDAYQYSSDAANTTPSSGGTTGNEASKSFVLTTAQDVRTGGSGNDFFRGVAGQPVGAQEQTTFNSSDILDGAGGTDSLILNLVGDYNGGARVKAIENLVLGTNVGAVAFDYNVNEGFNEISNVQTIEYDQINVGEQVVVNNIVKTAGDNGDQIATLLWDNEATSVAGAIGANFRASAVLGATNLNIVLDDVMAQGVGSGAMTIGGGVETFTITSQGATPNTLNPGQNNDGQWVDLVSGSNDGTNDNGALTKVVVKGAQAFGRTAGVAELGSAFYGLTNRSADGAAGDWGLDNNRASASNLTSVAGTVTEVDASETTGGVAIDFVGRVNNAPVNVTFKGGSGNDYVEFEIGSVNATGGAGNDTFAFVSAKNNGTFGSTDSIDGGAGTDTIQIGLNGVRTYNISATEFNNKGSIEVVDLRGQTNNITLSQEFVGKADTKLTVRSDKIVQTSATDSGNDLLNTPAGNLLLEDRAVTTLDTTNLDQNTGLIYLGGSGSDRLILDNESFNQFVELDGGTNLGQGAVATNGDYDTLSVRNSAVIDRGDLANVKNFEGLVLVKTDASAQYTIELTEAFLLANTKTNDLNAAYGETDIRDQTFFIGTVAAANANALSFGDTVNVDITDLLNATRTALKTSLNANGGRGLDLTSLAAAGVTVNYIVDGAPATGAQIVLVTNNDPTGVASVIGASPAIPGGTPLFFNGTVADETVTLVANGNSVNMAGGADTVNTGAALAPTGNLDGGAGADTLNAAAGVNLTGANISNFETLNLNGAATLNAAQYAAFTTVTAAGPADAVTLATTGNVNGFAVVETYNLSAAGNQITLAGASAQTINGGVGADTVIASGTNIANKTISLNGGADTVTVTGLVAAVGDAFTLAAAGASGANLTGVETVNFSNGLINGPGVMTMFNGAATVNLAGAVGDTSATDALQLGSGGQTVNVTGTDGFTLAGGSGADTFNLSGLTAGAASTTITLSGANVAFGAANANGAVSLVTAFDTITGFRAGVDKIDAATPGGANQLTTINVNVSTSLADLAGTLSNAVTQARTLAVANWNDAGDALLVNISSGTAAGTYLVQNAAADATFDAAAELVVKLVGTVGVITQADII